MTVLGALHVVALVLAIVLAVPVAVFTLEVLAGRSRRGAPSAATALDGAPPSIAVLMPAHDEAPGIGAPIAAIVSQLAPGDRLLVVADNCSDETAGVARTAGAEVIERVDPLQRGKGYALDFGVRHLAAAPPDVVIVVDADCIVEPGALAALARQAARRHRPVQGLYLMRAPSGAPLKTRIAEFAWRVRNQLRPAGNARMGWPCQLMGTGMAFPWRVIEGAPLASGHLVEDLELGLVLAARGQAPVFCADACITSVFPEVSDALVAQRTRWEHGHLGVIGSLAPRLFVHALGTGSPTLLALLLDLCVPPVAALVLLLVAALAVAGVAAAFGASVAALVVAGTALALLCATLIVAWRSAGRDVLSARELASIPGYVLGKVGIYRRLFGRRQTEWVRTRRDDGSA